MDYLLLLITILLLALKGYCGKKCSGYVKAAGDAFVFNLIRMLFCTVIGFAIIFAESSLNKLHIDGTMLAICVAAGAANAAFLIGWMFAIERNTMVAVDVTMTVGSILPAVLCFALFSEAILPQKMLGFLLISIAAVILSGYNGGKEKKRGFSGIFFLLLATLGEGMTGFCQQLYVRFGDEYPKSVYHFYTYCISAVILLICFIISRAHTSAEKQKTDIRKPLPHIAVMAVCLFAANYLQTVLTGDYGMASQILYPVIKGSGLITVTLVAMLFFGERPTKRSLLGTFTALIGVIAINSL